MNLPQTWLTFSLNCKISTPQVVHNLGRCLREEHEPLPILALKALARLGARDVADVVVPMVLETGALREYALKVVTAVGPPVIPQLTALYKGADFHGKRSVSIALSQIGGRTAFGALARESAGDTATNSRTRTGNQRYLIF